MRTPHCTRLAVSLACLAAMTGCALNAPPDVKGLTETELAHATPPAAWKAGAAAGALQDNWLASFGDARLLPLAEEALRYNVDLRAAAARVESAAASVKAADGSLYPEVNLIGRTSGKATGSGVQLSGLFVPASWELDLWGRVRYGQRAAQDQYASAEADQRSAQQSIVATLAKAWFLAAEASQQQRLVGDMQAAAERLLKLAEDRQRVGAGSEVDVALARANVQSYRDSARQIDFSLSQSRRALELLLGRSGRRNRTAFHADDPAGAGAGWPAFRIAGAPPRRGRRRAPLRRRLCARRRGRREPFAQAVADRGRVVDFQHDLRSSG